MKILVFGDLHGSLSALKKIEGKSKHADLLLCHGDLTIFEQNLEYIMKRLGKIKKNIFLTHGNHESENVLRKVSSFHKNIIFLHKKKKKIEEVLFLGYGGGGFSVRDKEFEKFIKKNKQEIKKHKTILLIHAPPYGTKIDMINKEHVGNKSIRDFIHVYKPILVVCGHIHEGFGEDKIKKTLILNPGPKGKIIEIK